MSNKIQFIQLEDGTQQISETGIITFDAGSILRVDTSTISNSLDVVNVEYLTNTLGNFGVNHTISVDETISQKEMYNIWGDVTIDAGKTLTNNGRLVIVNGNLVENGTYTQGGTGSLELVNTNLDYILGRGNAVNGQNILWTNGAGTWSSGNSTTHLNSAPDNSFVTKEWTNAAIAGVSSPSLYTASGTVPTGVVATITDTLDFNEGSFDLFGLEKTKKLVYVGGSGSFGAYKDGVLNFHFNPTSGQGRLWPVTSGSSNGSLLLNGTSVEIENIRTKAPVIFGDAGQSAGDANNLEFAFNGYVWKGVNFLITQISGGGADFEIQTSPAGLAGTYETSLKIAKNKNISLLSTTTIQGTGTSTGTTLALYDNDTTPNKTWEWLDDGNVNINQNSGIDLNSNDLTFKNSTNTNAKFFANGDVALGGSTIIGVQAGITLHRNTLVKSEADTSANISFQVVDTGNTAFIKVLGDKTTIIRGSSLIGTEEVSLQGNTLIDGSLDMNNNRITKAVVNPSVQEAANSATFTINADEETDGVLTAMAANTTIAAPTGTPVQSQSLTFKFKDDGTARTLTWNAIFRGINGATLPTATLGSTSDLIIVKCLYNSTDSKWDVYFVGGSSAASGKFGITDATGSYTYYTTFALALAAASSGDTIEVFANTTETSDITVTCVNGVNINFNGYTYTLNTTGTSNAFTVPASASLEIYNGKIKRIGGTSSLTNSVSISATGSGVLTLNSMILESDFGNASYLSSSTRTVKGGDFVGESLGVFISNARLENAKASANSGAGLQIQNNGTAINCYGFSTSSYGVYNNSSNAHSCIGRSTGDIGFYGAGGYNFDCKGYSSSSYGASITGANKCANIFGYSSASAGVNILGNGTNVTGFSTSSYGVRYSSGSGDHFVDDVKAFSTAASGMYVLKNAGKVEFSDINVSTTWNDAAGHALTVAGSDDDVIFSGGNLRVQNSSANGLYAASAKSCYFVGLKFRGCAVAINSNITNLQSNTPDIYGNVLIG